MAQSNYNLANVTYPQGRIDINANYSAIGSNNSGTSAPTVTFPNMWWFNDSLARLEQRNSANTDWIVRAITSGSDLVPVGSNALSLADNSTSCPSTGHTRALLRGWKTRIAAAGSGTQLNLATERKFQNTYVAWGTPDIRETQEIDTSVLQFDAVNGEVQVKKSGWYAAKVLVNCRTTSNNNNLIRSQWRLRAYYGTTSGAITAGDVFVVQPQETEYGPGSDSFSGDHGITIAWEWEFQKTTTGTTEYFYPTLIGDPTFNTGGGTVLIDFATIDVRCTERNEA